MISLFMFSSLADGGSSQNEEEKGIADLLFFLNPAKVEFLTSYTPEGLTDLIEEYRVRALNGEMLELGVNTGYIEMDVKEEKAKLTFFSSRFGALKKALKVKVETVGEDKELTVKGRVPYSQMKDLYKGDPSFQGEEGRWKFSKSVESRLKRALEL